MPQPKTASGAIDDHDPLPVLTYTGDASGQPFIPGVPARDLNGGDLARLASIDRRTRRHAMYVAEGLEPRDEPMTPRSMADELVARGPYRYASEEERKAAMPPESEAEEQPAADSAPNEAAPAADVKEA